MFTGLIESVGIVSDIAPTSSGFTVTIHTPMGSELHQGDSVSVNGVCLTVTACNESGWTADIGPETARVSTLGALRQGKPVNLERSMRADGRFGGHFVQGHVDGVGVVDGLLHGFEFGQGFLFLVAGAPEVVVLKADEAEAEAAEGDGGDEGDEDEVVAFLFGEFVPVHRVASG